MKKCSKRLQDKLTKLGFRFTEKLEDGYGGPSIMMYPVLNKKGDYIADAAVDAERLLWLDRHGIAEPLALKHGQTCCYGKSVSGKFDGSWIGWSHRAAVSFKIGDMLFDKSFVEDDTPFNRCGNIVITTDAQAREAAKRFARYIS